MGNGIISRLVSAAVTAMLVAAPLSAAVAASYTELDEKIVRAYNCDPKQTQDVYIYAMQIIERARLDHSDEANSWKDKGEKLVTVACFDQADKHLNNKNYRDAYLWALRGISNGASRGELGGVEMKQVYDYLKYLTESLKSQAGTSYGQEKLDALDWRRVKKSSAYKREDSTDPAGRPEVKDLPYQVLAGPAVDSSGLLTVKVRLSIGSILKVRFFQNRGWMIIDPPVMSGGYRPTWEECIEEVIKTDNLPGAPPPVRNSTVEKKVYYQPEKASDKRINGSK